MKMNIRQASPSENGFGVTEIIIAILIVLLLTGISYYVWHKHKAGTNTSAPATSQSQPSTTSNNTKSGTLYVKEWGISLKYHNTQANLQYLVDSSNQNMAIITSTQLASAFPKCSLASMSATGIGALSRGKPTDVYTQGQTYQQILDKNPSATVALGGYVYIYKANSQSCSGSASNILQQNANSAAISIFQ